MKGTRNLPLPTVTGRTGQDNTLRGVLSVQQSALDMSNGVLDKLSSPTVKAISVEKSELIRCWRNWPSDGEPFVVWSGSFKVPLNDWYRGRK